MRLYPLKSVNRPLPRLFISFHSIAQAGPILVQPAPALRLASWHDRSRARLLSSGWLEWFRNIVGSAQDWIVDVTRPACAVCSPKTKVN